MHQSHAAIQRDLNRLEKRADGNLMQFNTENCKALHLGSNNPMHQYMLGADLLENSFTGQTLRLPVDTKLNMGQQHTLVAKAANGVLGYCQQVEEVILPLYSALVRPHLECCVQCWALQHKRDRDILEKVQ